MILRKSIVFLLLLSYGVCYCQTYYGKSADTFYSCSLKINKDSTVLFNYRMKDNACYADFKGSVKRLNDSLYRLSCASVFTQYVAKNFFDPDLCIGIDSILDQSKQITFAKVHYTTGLDTVY